MMTAVIVAALVVGNAEPVYANSDESSSTPLEETIDSALAEVGEAADGLVSPVEAPDGIIEATTIGPGEESTITIETKKEVVEVSLDDLTSGSGLSLTLPEVSEIENAEISADGSIVFQSGVDQADLVVQALDDGAVRVLTIIGDSDASTEYKYEFDLPAGTKLNPTADGGVQIMDADGSSAGAILPAWAVDAAGNDIETFYRVDGATVTQIVQHDADGVVYPVVADPKIYYAWWQIFSWSEWKPTSYPKGQLSIALSGYGRWDVITAADQFLSSGWSLLRSKYSSSILTTSMRQQWECHVLGGIAEWGTFDLERHRYSNPNWRNRIGRVWPLQNVCNW